MQLWSFRQLTQVVVAQVIQTLAWIILFQALFVSILCLFLVSEAALILLIRSFYVYTL